MSVVTKNSVAVAAGPHGYPEFDRHFSTQGISTMKNSESGRRIGIRDLINEPIRSSPSINTPKTPSTEHFHLNCYNPEFGQNQFNNHHHHHHHHRNHQYSSLSPPPQLPLPLPPHHQTSQHLIPTPTMEIDSYKLPTPMTSPTSIPITSPPLASYSPSSSTASTPSPITGKSDDQASYMTTIQTSGMIMPLSLQERRERNKIASAKYRAKKHRQNQEMSTTIAELTAENNVLLRQIEEIRTENLELKELVDKLKSKLVEGKILKRLGRGGAKLTLSPASIVDDDLEITSNTMRKNTTKRGGYGGHAKGTGPSKSSRK